MDLVIDLFFGHAIELAIDQWLGSVEGVAFSLQTVVDYDVAGVIPVIWITPHTANTVSTSGGIQPGS